jgi:serine phosphatase RsbU (regulator of sigma subunit)
MVDATGHGRAPAPVSSALTGSIVGAVLRGVSPAGALRRADERVRSFGGELPYAVAFVAIVDPQQGVLYASAGHDLAFTLHDDGHIDELEPTAPMLGVSRAFHAGETRIAFDKTQTLAIASDGVADSHPAGTQTFFRSAAVARVVARALFENEDPARAVLEAALAHDGGRQRDDMSVVVARIGWGGSTREPPNLPS